MVAALPLAGAATGVPYLTSPTMTTPRPVTATLLPQSQHGVIGPISPIRSAEHEGSVDGDGDGILPDDSASGRDEDVQSTVSFEISPDDAIGERDEGDEGGDLDGRMTPLASEHSRQSPALAGSSDPATTANSNPAQQSFNALPSPPAEIGLSSLATEKQLREAASGKDRMFLLLLSQEIEPFIKRVVNGEQGGIEVQQGHATSAAMSTFGPAMMLTTTTTSKYQRMLMYKAAEWYGLRGICGPDNNIYIGVIGSLPEKSSTLRFSDLAPKPPTPKQSFKIMQRVPLGSGGSASSRAGSAGGDDSSEAGGSKRKTLEEREAEYALARERIYGVGGESESTDMASVGTDEPRGRAARRGDDEDGFVPRRTAGPPQPVYASLYHPKPEPSPPVPPQQAYQPDPMFAFQPNTPTYAYNNYGNGYQQHPLQAYPPRQGYMDGSAPPFVPQTGYNVNPQWQQMPQPPGPMPGPSQGWYNPSMGPNQPTMPMIPQGVTAYPQQYPQQYPYHQQQLQQGYGSLVQPTPLRPAPQPHPHSSTSSSISSRSYQDYSRPHSRGSTTSTRSATSSVRLGAMYPAGNVGHAGPGYRQKGIKGQGVNGLTTLGPSERRSTRGHSPSSATTNSSRSSRRAASIQVQPPASNQHQLPQRPDWAANNVPYHPSPIVPPGAHMANAPSTTDFPPLRQNFHAVPMQVERAKHMPPKGTVWNGRGAYTNVQVQSQASMQSASQTAAQSTLTREDQTASAPAEIDPDFPRRVPAGRVAGTLFDPSGDAAKHSPMSVASVPESTATTAVSVASSTVADGLSVEEEIEAKLQALSINQGIAIGPPPNKAPSYAKIVRRE